VAFRLGWPLPFRGDIAEQGFKLGAKHQVGIRRGAQRCPSVSLGRLQFAASQRPLGGELVPRRVSLVWRQCVNSLPQRLDEPAGKQFIPARARSPCR